MNVLRILAFLLILLAPLTLQAQKDGVPAQASNDSLTLEVAGRVKIPLATGPFGRAKCDDDGSVYLRPYDPARVRSHTQFQTPIQKINADGTLGATFRSTDGMSDLAAKDFWGRDFFVRGDGALYQVVFTKRELYVLEFSSDGSFKSRTKIQTEYFNPYQIAIFKSGEILLSGAQGEAERTPVARVFDSAGRLLRKISEPEDESAKKRAEAGDRDFILENLPNFGNASVQWGEAVPGSDGNVYLMRAGSPALIFAISPHGEVIRKFRVDPGISGMPSESMKAAAGKLAITFGRPHSPDALVKVVDLEGNPVAGYTFGDLKILPAFLACYAPPAFTFVNSDDGNVYVQKVEPR